MLARCRAPIVPVPMISSRKFSKFIMSNHFFLFFLLLMLLLQNCTLIHPHCNLCKCRLVCRSFCQSWHLFYYASTAVVRRAYFRYMHIGACTYTPCCLRDCMLQIFGKDIRYSGEWPSFGENPLEKLSVQGLRIWRHQVRLPWR